MQKYGSTQTKIEKRRKTIKSQNI